MDFIHKYFDPPEGEDLPPAGDIDTDPEKARPVYVYTPEIKLAVNVAFAADRPLLVTGDPGSGKSTLAINVAQEKRRRYLPEVITSRTQAGDLLGRFDAVRRLNDASGGGGVLPDAAYVDPGVLWWALDPRDAKVRGATDLADWDETQRNRFKEATPPPGAAGETGDVVVLLDEIDKADPDVPNDLLEPLDRGEFKVKPTDHPVTRKHQVFMVITTNGERELPPAFMRRCVVLNLEPVDESWLKRVAQRHFGKRHESLYEPLAKRLVDMQKAAEAQALRPPSTAEYLNAIRACGQLRILPGTAVWNKVDEVLQATMWKHKVAPRDQGKG